MKEFFDIFTIAIPLGARRYMLTYTLEISSSIVDSRGDIIEILSYFMPSEAKFFYYCKYLHMYRT